MDPIYKDLISVYVNKSARYPFSRALSRVHNDGQTIDITKLGLEDTETHEYENMSTYGFSFAETHLRDTTMVMDPRGFITKISHENLKHILKDATITNGVIQDECRWAHLKQGVSENAKMLVVKGSFLDDAILTNTLYETKGRTPNKKDVGKVFWFLGIKMVYLGKMSMASYSTAVSMHHATQRCQLFVTRHNVYVQLDEGDTSSSGATLDIILCDHKVMEDTGADNSAMADFVSGLDINDHINRLCRIRTVRQIHGMVYERGASISSRCTSVLKFHPEVDHGRLELIELTVDVMSLNKVLSAQDISMWLWTPVVTTKDGHRYTIKRSSKSDKWFEISSTHVAAHRVTDIDDLSVSNEINVTTIPISDIRSVSTFMHRVGKRAIIPDQLRQYVKVTK